MSRHTTNWTLVILTIVVWNDGEGFDRYDKGIPKLPLSLNNIDHRLRVFHEGSWGDICARGWDSKDASVVCRMRGFWHNSGTALIVPVPTNGKVWLDNVNCNGNETSLLNCTFIGWGIPSCLQLAIAGVNCELSVPLNVRLTNGYGPWEGRVEVFEEGSWQPVCSDGWDDLDASVVCRQLGLRYSGGFASTSGKYNDSHMTPMITESACEGGEKYLSSCHGTRYERSDKTCPGLAGVECYNCGSEYTSLSGTVASENFPNKYPRNTNCLFVIRPSNPRQLYKLQFLNFLTEGCCDIVRVSILNSTTFSAPTSGKYSGVYKPPMLLGNAFAITFKTDGSNERTGFQARWSPAVVEDVIIMTCGSGILNISIDLPFLKRLYPQSSERTIALADPSCTGHIYFDNIVIQTLADRCGTIITKQSDSYVYHNFLVDRLFARESQMIVRAQRWKIPITCTVPRTDSFSIHYKPYPKESKRGAAPELARSLSQREVKGHIVIQQDFPVSIKIYQDKSMTTKESSSVVRNLGDMLYFRVILADGDSDLKLVVNDCFASPVTAPTAAQTYSLIKAGCTTDSTTSILAVASHNTDISLQVFKFAGNYDKIYIYCDVRVCPASDPSANCRQTCRSTRSVSTNQYKDRTVTYGPIIIRYP